MTPRLPTLAERLRFARELTGMNMSQLGRAAGLSRASVHQLESGTVRRPTSEKVFSLAKALDVDPRWLADGTGPMKGVVAVNAADAEGLGWLNLPVLETNMPAQGGARAEWQLSPTRAVPVPQQVLDDVNMRAEHAAVVRMTDASMEHTLAAGDHVLVDLSDKTLASGKVYVLFAAGELLVRRLYPEIDGGLTIKADNERLVPPRTVAATLMDRVEIVGRVRYRWGSAEF